MKRRSFFYAASALAMLAGLPAQAQAPNDLNIAVILSAGVESPWDGTLISALERAKEAKPHDLDISWTYTDPLWGDEAGDAMRLFAETGEYDIIWAHSSYSDQVKKMQAEFPETMFVVVGSGNEGLGGNQYWVYKRIHEAAYAVGVLAGHMTQTGTLGVVGTFPADDVNDEINAFFAGARSVKPELSQKVAFIESWYDPGKAAEMTQAQISTGADMILSLASNFAPCTENNLLCFGNFGDMASFAPETVLTSALAHWDPDLEWIIGEWYGVKAEGKAFNGNTELKYHGLAEGGSAVAPFYGLEGKVPAPAMEAFKTTLADISSGALVVPVDVSAPVSK